jgi:HSP20 family molecular chaperone IbpA
MDRMWDDRMSRLAREGGGRRNPPVDAWEDGDAVVIELAVPTPTRPGRRALRAGPAGRQRRDRAARPGRWVIHERARGATAQFTLRTPVRPTRPRPLRERLLTLTLPKSESVKPRKIAVQSA